MSLSTKKIDREITPPSIKKTGRKNFPRFENRRDLGKRSNTKAPRHKVKEEKASYKLTADPGLVTLYY